MRKHNGFTLVELVVVVMILGILAAVAAPKLLGTSSAAAADNGIKQSLAIVRDAIERYAAEHGGALPGQTGDEADFKTELADYLRGTFPKCPVAGENNTIKMSATAVGFAGESGNDQDESWHYCQADGRFIVNSIELTNNTNDEATLQYDQL